MFLCNNGTVYVSGDNTKGQIGLGGIFNTSLPTFLISNITKISLGYEFTILLSNGNIYCFGSNNVKNLLIF